MDPPLGEALTRWTIRLAVACYLGRLAIDARGTSSLAADRMARGFWTAGYVLFIAHVALAFEVFHGWSHAEAYAHTARRTEDVVGLKWGGGLYVNYAIIALWTADLAAWWSMGRAYSGCRAIYWPVQAVFAFIVVNATVVFGSPYWIAVAAAAIPCLIWLRLRRGAP